MKKKVFSIIFIINGIYYLFAEFLSVLNIKNKASSYIRNTISELGMTTSPLYILMNSAFILTGILFFLAYIYLFKYNNKIKKYIGLFFALMLSIGSIMVGVFHSVEINTSILHQIGTILVFAGGNLLILFIGLFYNKTPYSKICTILGTLGIWGGIMVIFSTINEYTKFIPLLERMTVYPIILFQIITGIYFLLEKSTIIINY